MPKFRIRWDAGFGESSHVIEVATKREAIAEAYVMALDQFESNALWGAELVEEVERSAGHVEQQTEVVEQRQG